jgi:hypothetical protein
MQTKNVYCGDGWEFQIIKDGEDLELVMKNKHTPVQRWELEELAEFLKRYLENK